jgi:quinol monooxygenase YgiN
MERQRNLHEEEWQNNSQADDEPDTHSSGQEHRVNNAIDDDDDDDDGSRLSNFSDSIHDSDTDEFLVAPDEETILNLPVKTLFVHDVFLSKVDGFYVKINHLLGQARKLPSCQNVMILVEAKEPSVFRSTSNDEKTVSSSDSSPLHSKEAQLDEEQHQPQKQELSRKFLSCGTHLSLSDLTHTLSAPYNVPFTEWMITQKVYNGGFPVFTMWHRVNELYSHANPSINEGSGLLSSVTASVLFGESEKQISRSRSGGKFYVTRTHSLNEPLVSKTLVLQILCQLAAVSCSPQKIINTNNSIADEQKEEATIDPDTQASRISATEEEGQTQENRDCIFYDVLVSNDRLDRFHEVVEWTSWASREAYQHHMARPHTVQHHRVVSHLCSTSEETAWEYSDHLIGD